MIKKALFLIFLFIYHLSNGQQVAYFNDGDGKPIYFSRTNFTEEGNACLYNEYRLARVTTNSNVIYDSINVKLNLINGDIQYLDAKGKEMVTLIPVKKIQFYSCIKDGELFPASALIGLPAGLNQAGSEIYEVLDSGKIQLLKQIKMTYRDETKYGQAGIVRIYEKKSQLYWLGGNKKLQKIEKSKKDILDLITDKKEIMQNFIQTQNLNYRNEKDLITIFKYYNSLFSDK
jgi:hypothetical protein